MVGPSKHLKFNAPRASSFTSFGFFVAISVLMMVVDHQMQVMEPVRSGFAWVSDWIHNGVSSPARGVDFADSYLRSKSSLIAQNEELKKRLAESEMQRYRMSTLSEENRVLKEMLQQKRFTRLKQECLKFAAHFRTVLHSAIKLTADPMTVLRSVCRS